MQCIQCRLQRSYILVNDIVFWKRFKLKTHLHCGLYCPQSSNLHLQSISKFFFNYLFIYFWLCWVSIDVWAFALAVVSRGYPSVVMCRLPYGGASLAMEHRLQGTWASAVAAHGLAICSSWALEHSLSSRDTWAQLFHNIGGLPRPGIKPMSAARAGRFFTTEPREKPISAHLYGSTSKSHSYLGNFSLFPWQSL